MNVIVFGATGMVGQAAVRAGLADPDVGKLVLVGRSASGVVDPKVKELVVPDLYDLSAVAGELVGLDGCLFCLGVSSAGMTEAAYTRVTYDLTMVAAQALLAASPGITFIYVSGAGTDSTAQGRTMWARVKGKLENDLLALPFRAAYMFRPGVIQPLHGIKSRTRSYRIFYAVGKPILTLVRLLAPNAVLNTDELGRAMLRAIRSGAPKKILESADLRALS